MSQDPYGQSPAAYGQSPAAYGQSPAAYGQSPAPYGGQPAPYGQASRGQVSYGQVSYGQDSYSGQDSYGGQPGLYGGSPARTSVPATNSKAIVAICLGFAAPLVGLVFGILALREIQRTGEGGKGFAVTGIVLGVLLLLFVVAYIGLIVALFSSAMSGGAMSSDLFGS